MEVIVRGGFIVNLMKLSEGFYYLFGIFLNFRIEFCVIYLFVFLYGRFLECISFKFYKFGSVIGDFCY